MQKNKTDFERLIPETPKLPETPPCDAPACCAKSHYRIDGRYYCKRHGPQEALKYLNRIGLNG